MLFRLYDIFFQKISTTSCKSVPHFFTLCESSALYKIVFKYVVHIQPSYRRCSGCRSFVSSLSQKYCQPLAKVSHTFSLCHLSAQDFIKRTRLSYRHCTLFTEIAQSLAKVARTFSLFRIVRKPFYTIKLICIRTLVLMQIDAVQQRNVLSA